MKVSSHIADRAHRFFAVALAGGQDGEGKNFVQGRKSEYVVAACLYVACRMNKTNHMLIDFADIVQVSLLAMTRYQGSSRPFVAGLKGPSL